jgi:hypothetical protein
MWPVGEDVLEIPGFILILYSCGLWTLYNSTLEQSLLHM